MRDLILKMSMTVDGFVCGPNDEIDWSFATSDAASQAWTRAERCAIYAAERVTHVCFIAPDFASSA